MQANSIYTRLLVVLCTVMLYSCTTTVSVNSKRISQNHRFNGGITIYAIAVDSFDRNGAPASYSRSMYCEARNRRSVRSDDDAIAVLKGEQKQEFLRLKAGRDSLEKISAPENSPADTINIINGPRIYRAAGMKRPAVHAIIQYEMDEITNRVKTKERKVIYFTKRNKQYHWHARPGKEEMEKAQRISFEPGRWYAAYMSCTYGFMADGTCKLYFRFDNRGKVEFHRLDNVNDRPF
jgi:hypothetical protein